MRVTHNSFYNHYSQRQTHAIGTLNETYEQITTKKQISDGYQDPLKLINTLNLESQESFFSQINNIADQAINFSRNTDSILGDFQNTLIQFKQKLVNAANGNHSSTSLNSIAQEMEVLIRHLRDLSNVSVNRNYLFAGSNLTQQPISADLEYLGNRDDLGILLGKTKSRAAYNISGYELFFGKDSDVNKVVSSNIGQLNKTKLYPKLMTQDYKQAPPREEYIKSTDTIRDLVGDNDADDKNNHQVLFYLRGKDTYGNLIKEKIYMDSGDNISTLQAKITDLYDDFVDVEINENGQFRISSKVEGNGNLDFHMFAAVDRTPNSKEQEEATGYVNQADVDNIDDLLMKKDVDIVEFIYSNLSTAKIASSVISRQDIYEGNKIFLRSSFSKVDQTEILQEDKLQEVFHNELNKLTISGKDVDGNAVNFDLDVDKETSIQHFFGAIQDTLSGPSGDKKVIVSIKNDKIIVQDNTKTTQDKTLLELKLTANDGNLNVFRGLEAMNIDRVGFSKDKDELISKLPQIDKLGEYATRKTALSEVSQSNLKDSSFIVDFINTDGIEKQMSIDLGSRNSTFTLDGKTYDIINPNRLYVATGSTQDKLNIPLEYNLEGIQVGDTISLNGVERVVTEVDQQYSYIKVDQPFNTTIKAGDMIGFVSPPHKRTTDKNATYGQLMDILGMAMSSQLPEKSGDVKAYEAAVLEYKKYLDVSLDIRGRLKIVDKIESLSKIELSIYDRNSNDFSKNNSPSILFNANNAIVIDEPNIDFFKDLKDAVFAVKNGIIATDSYSQSARNRGIRGSIRAIDHLSDHVAKMRTIAGTNSQTLKNNIQRLKSIITNTKELKNEVIATDVAKTMVEFNEQALNYSALLKIIGKINELSLANYYK